jgi:nitroreductase
MKAAIKTRTRKETETIQTIYERRAVRKYKDLPVSTVTIEKILDAACMAPSAMNEQPWRFHILTQKETIQSFSKEIAKIVTSKVIKSGPRQILKTIAGLIHFSFSPRVLLAGDPVFYGAPVVIFISAPKDNAWAALDIGMCAENMMLAAKSLGVDSCPVGFGKFVEQTKIYSRLGVPASDHVHLAVILGYGDENPPVHKRIRDNSFFIEIHQSPQAG